MQDSASFMNDRFEAVVREIDLLLAESARLQARGPHFRIEHRFRKAGTICRAGEEIFAVWLIYRSQLYQLKLSLALRVLFDYLARHGRCAQSATQIEIGIRADQFCARHGANAKASRKQTRILARSGVKVYIRRIREALQTASVEAHLDLDSSQILMAEPTVGNEVVYRLKGTFAWTHV